MKKSIFILLVIFQIIFFTSTLEAQQRGVQIRLSGQELFETAPKNVLTTTFEVVNTSDEELEFISDIKLPPGWKIITPFFPFRLAPNASEIRLVSFFVPRSALADKYELSFQVRANRDPSISNIARIFVEVLSVTKLQVKLLQAPEYVIAGDKYDVRFSIINESNTDKSVIINVQSSQNLPCVFKPRKMELAPGEARPVNVTVKTDEKIKEAFKHFLKLTVQDAKDAELKGQARSSVNIFPRITGETDLYHRIPAELAVRIDGRRGEESEHMLQGEFSGKGSLDEQGDHQVAFLFQGPDTLENGLAFGEHDRYFLGYQNKRLDLGVGDDYFFLSRLTEQSIDGRGVNGSLHTGDFEFKAYYMETRRLDPEEQEIAFQLGYVFSDRDRVGLNLFNKKNNMDDNRIVSLQGNLEPFNNAGIKFEAAYGSNERRQDIAYWINLYGSPDWGGAYRLEYIYAEPDFPGYYQDKEYLSGNFFFPIRKRFSVNGTLRQEKQNLNLDMIKESAALERYGMLGLNYRLDTGTTFSLETQGRLREDRLPDPNFNSRQLTLRARVSQNFNRCFFNASGEWGNTDGRLRDSRSGVNIYEGSIYMMPTDHQTYGGFVRYSIDGESENENREMLNSGINGSIGLGRSAQLNLKVEKYEYMGTEAGDRFTIDGTLSHRFSNAWILSLRERHTIYDDTSNQCDETVFFAELSMPIGVPVSRKKSVGMIKGSVRDQKTAAPLANVILRLSGVIAVTDWEGRFVFPAMKPGNYYLDIDRASIGLDRIPIQKMPLTVNVTGGDDVSLHIAITQGADLTGRIEVYDFGGPAVRQKGFSIANRSKGDDVQEGTDKLTETGGLANVVLELSSQLESWRVMTDRKGRFRFDNVRPGQWILTAYTDNIPQYHYLENSRIEIELAPGDAKEILMRVLPKKRTIQIIEEGELLIEEEIN